MSRDVWGLDKRPILSAFLPSDDPNESAAAFRIEDGWVFERFERNGEMAAIPYLRITREGQSFEAPLRHFVWVRFKEVE